MIDYNNLIKVTSSFQKNFLNISCSKKNRKTILILKEITINCYQVK